MEHIQKALEFDMHVRRDLDERLPAIGIQVTVRDIEEGVVYEADGVKVTAFLVDHGPLKPAFGYRVDYKGHSVASSGDTKLSETYPISLEPTSGERDSYRVDQPRGDHACT